MPLDLSLQDRISGTRNLTRSRKVFTQHTSSRQARNVLLDMCVLSSARNFSFFHHNKLNSNTIFLYLSKVSTHQNPINFPSFQQVDSVLKLNLHQFIQHLHRFPTITCTNTFRWYSYFPRKNSCLDFRCRPIPCRRNFTWHHQTETRQRRLQSNARANHNQMVGTVRRSSLYQEPPDRFVLTIQLTLHRRKSEVLGIRRDAVIIICSLSTSKVLIPVNSKWRINYIRPHFGSANDCLISEID